MPRKVTPIAEAVALVPERGSVGAGGSLGSRTPVALLHALGGSGRRDLTLWTMLGGLDAEVLAAHDALAAVGSIYVGFEGLGGAPAYEAAVADGRITTYDHSEFTLVGGLRAALAGLPFFPTRGAMGSDVAAGLGLETVADPYTGEELLAAPAIRPDVTFLHAEAATEDGAVLQFGAGDFLVEYDQNVARAAGKVVVSVERLAEPDEARSRGLLLHGFEVDAIVVAPGGARPAALPGVHPRDTARLSAYLEAAAGGRDAARAAVEELVG